MKAPPQFTYARAEHAGADRGEGGGEILGRSPQVVWYWGVTGRPRPAPRTRTEAERAEWRELNRGIPRQAQESGDFPESTTTRERFFRRER